MALPHTGHGVFVLGGEAARPASHMLEKHAVFVPGDGFFGFKERQKAVALEFALEFFRDFGSGEFAESRKHIEVRGEIFDLMGRPVPGPAPEGKDARAPFPSGGFAATHVGVVDIQPPGSAVVGHEDDDGFFVEALFFQKGHDATDVVVQVCDHPEVLGLLLGNFPAKWRDEFLGRGQRVVRRVGREVGEEWLVTALGDEFHRIIEINIFAIALHFLALAISHHHRIEVLSRPVAIRGAPLKSPVLRSIPPIISEMPFSNEASPIAC